MALGALLLASGAPTVVGAPLGSAPAPAAGAAAALSVSWGGPTLDLAPAFWGTDVRPYVAIGSPQAGWWSQTPLDIVVWPGGAVGDAFNYTSGVITNLGGGTYQAPQSTSQFVAWCRSVSCHAIFQLPAEVNQPALGADYVAYTEKTLGYHPDYWEIGNEPAHWQNFNVPWSEWGKVAGQSISPATYATVVHSYIAAVRAVDPSARFVGLPGTGIGASQETTWLGDTVSVNGPNLSAVAIHVYPAGTGSGTATLSGFFGSLSGKGSLTARVPADEAAVRTACPTCGPIPIFVTESNAGISGGIWDTYMANYPEVPYMAAQIVQAIHTGVVNLDLFSFEGSYPGSLFTGTGVAQPIYTFYSGVLPHLGTVALPTSLRTPEEGAYAQATLSADGSAAALLIVNANASTTLTVSLAGSGFPSGGPAGLWAWNTSSIAPAFWTDPGGAPAALTVPPEGVLLVRSPTTGSSTPSYPVRFSESGLPAGTAWSVSFRGALLPSTNATVSTEAVNGTYSFFVPNLPSWNATPASGSVVVAGAGVSRTIQFSPAPKTPGRYSVEFVPSGAAGPATWSVRLGNATETGNASLAFSEPNGTYAFSVTPPSGMTASPQQGTLTVAGSALTNTVTLLPNGTPPPPVYTAQFVPRGLPSGASWKVALGSSVRTGGGDLGFAVTNGSYSFGVTAPNGSTAAPASGTIVVAGANVSVTVQFTAAPPPPPPGPGAYPVQFLPHGLPANVTWSVAISSGTDNSSHGDQPVGFVLRNGTYSYSLSAVAGYAAEVPSGTIVVSGGGWLLNVTFAPATTPPSPGLPSASSPPASPLGLLGHSWLLIALLGIVAGSAVYSVERGLRAVHGRRRYSAASTDGARATSARRR